MSASPSSSGVSIGGAVASSHYLASEAGREALIAGGNAIDAAIAAASVLCVVYPNNVALGGDLVALVRNPEGEIRFVNATGRAASGETLASLRSRHGERLPERGVDTITVPGGVRGWSALAALGGRLGWNDLLRSAHGFARDGAPVATSLARAIRLERAALGADPGCRALFLPGDSGLQEGERLSQPALAATFERLIANGPDEMYVGETAAKWVAGLHALGSRISAEDAASYSPVIEEPLRGSGLGYDVITAPPNTQGFSLLRALRALDGGAISDPLGVGAGMLADVFAANNRVRSRHLSDPDFADRTALDLVEMPAPVRTAGDRAATGDTVGLVAVSDDGWAVSLVQSVYWAFGSAVLEPETGILFQNRGTSFSLDEGHPAAFGPGRRPPHTLMPVLIERDGELAFAQATMGGQAQPQIHALLLSRLANGASALEATSAPRWVVGAQDDDDTPETLTIEADVTSSARRALEASDFDVKVVPPRSELLGHSNVIRLLPTGYDAASDPRSDGSAIVVDPRS